MALSKHFEVLALLPISRLSEEPIDFENGGRVRVAIKRVLELVVDARYNGGKVAVCGVRYGDRGFFVETTIVGELTDDARLVAEEQFGPALPTLSSWG